MLSWPWFLLVHLLSTNTWGAHLKTNAPKSQKFWLTSTNPKNAHFHASCTLGGTVSIEMSHLATFSKCVWVDMLWMTLRLVWSVWQFIASVSPAVGLVWISDQHKSLQPFFHLELWPMTCMAQLKELTLSKAHLPTLAVRLWGHLLSPSPEKVSSEAIYWLPWVIVLL